MVISNFLGMLSERIAQVFLRIYLKNLNDLSAWSLYVVYVETITERLRSWAFHLLQPGLNVSIENSGGMLYFLDRLGI